jgi:hypothetical protein
MEIKKIKTLLCGCLLLSGALAGSPVVADDNTGKYLIRGAPTCGIFLRELSAKSTANLRDYGWIAGYITAYNFFVPNTYDILGNSDMPSAELWVKSYCEKNPLKNMADAVESLMIELYPARKIKAPN